MNTKAVSLGAELAMLARAVQGLARFLDAEEAGVATEDHQREALASGSSAAPSSEPRTPRPSWRRSTSPERRIRPLRVPCPRATIGPLPGLITEEYE